MASERKRGGGSMVTRWREPGWNAENLRKPGLSPATVIDVGVAYGTRPLYEAFPDAYLVLIDPLHEIEETARRHLEGRRGEHLKIAVGAARGKATIRVDPEALHVSSIMHRSGGEPRPMELRTVPITTLDDLWGERGWTPPFGVKIDAEGYDYRVAEGATRLLRETQFVIAEVSVAERYEGDRSFSEFVGMMAAQSFELCDVLEGARSAARELVCLDAMFRHTGVGRD